MNFMRFGAHYFPTYIPHLDGSVEEFYKTMFAQMEELEQLGFGHLWVTEHHFSEYGGTLPHPPTFLSAIARSTQRIRLGVAVSVLPFHSPFEIAESYAMVDVISNGRLEFGIGRGSESIEFIQAGVSQEHSRVRMEEVAEVVEQAWSDEPVNFHGRFFDYTNVRVLPKPVQRPHPPIWVGCSRSDESFQWAGEKGFNLLTLPFLLPEELGRRVKIYCDALKGAGYNLATRRILTKVHVYVADSLEQAVREATPYLQHSNNVHKAANPNHREDRSDFASQMAKRFIIAGDPQRCIDAIYRLREELRLTTLSGTFHFGGMPQEMALKSIRLFAERVMPAFKRESDNGV
jgi:alkanesulfonate monooxygenase SsuD/methylene tetrahydromethanopterin reductase-like flavin-dependent oxidoreductase (luciferase family)